MDQYVTQEDLYFKDVFTQVDDEINIEANNINVNCLTSRQNKFSLDSDGNLSVNSIVSNNPISPNINYNELLDLVYPIGSIYLTINSTNPSLLFGGTWEEWGKGRVPIGLDSSQTEFNTVEKTGGSKTHNHTSAAHNHNINSCVALVNTYYNSVDMLGKDYNWTSAERVNGSSRTDSSRSNNWAAQTRGNTSTTTPGNTGSSSSLPPYITCYMWKRTA